MASKTPEQGITPADAEDLNTPLKSVLNFRDVGEFVNRATGTRLLKTRLLYRGARPDEATVRDRERLVQEYGVKSIIDLRTKTEHIEQAQKRDAKIKASAAVPQSNDDVAGPLKMPEVTYYEINFNGSAFSRMLISKLTWMEFFRLAGLMVFGYRLDAIKILSPHMEAMGLIGLAKNSIDVCTKEIKQVFDVFADDSNWPVLVHCTQGKDRTGLIVMLLLWLTQTDDEVIEKDYLLSEPELAPEKESRMKEIDAIGLSEQFAVCPPGLAKEVHSHIQEKYGGVEKYLVEKVGVSNETLRNVRRRMLAADS
ncbi:Protein-tyrosine-phosphatase [Ascochyta lentis]